MYLLQGPQQLLKSSLFSEPMNVSKPKFKQNEEGMKSEFILTL